MNGSFEHQRSSLLELDHDALHELSIIRSKQLSQLCPAISVLPTEILQFIFTFCIVHEASMTPCKNRLAFTQVCKHWRTLSLGMPTLWSTIDLSDVSFASLCLSRSGETLITVFSKRSCAEFDSGKLLAMRGARNRIRKLDVVALPNSMVRMFCDIAGWSFEFPDSRLTRSGSIRFGNLTDLTLRIPGICDPVDLSCLDVGGVRKMVLSGVQVDWGSTSEDLKVLSLNRLPGRFAPTLEELRGILERAGDTIEELCLEDISFLHEVPSWTERMETPSLRKLVISSKDQDFVETIVSSVTIGPSTEVMVRCGGTEMAVIDGELVDSAGDVGVHGRN